VWILHRLRYRFLSVLSWILSLCLLLVIGIIVGYLIWKAGRTMSGALLFGEVSWFDAVTGKTPVFHGIWPAVVGTLTLVLFSTIIAMPIGIATAIYLAEFASKRWASLMGTVVDMLAGVPSIVMGLWGFALILFLRKTLLPDANTCLFLASICIALLILPYVIRTTQNALSSIPQETRLIGPGLGLTETQNLLYILLPQASRGILSGMILAMGRAAEDTAVIMLTGAVSRAGLPGGLGDKFEALPFKIYILTSEYRDISELEMGYGCALILLIMTAGLFLVATLVQRKLEVKWNR